MGNSASCLHWALTILYFSHTRLQIVQRQIGRGLLQAGKIHGERRLIELIELIDDMEL